jgi:hypothetical protein
MDRIERVKLLLGECTDVEQKIIYNYLREKFPIHPLEKKLSISAEIILEAIARSSDLTMRGIRGIIAEASFKLNVIDSLSEWKDKTPSGDIPFDFLLNSEDKEVKVQVKMQRSKDQRPMMANEGYRFLSPDKYVVETQKTRGGINKDNADTRPYRFGEFDILAVSMRTSTNDWRSFLYTVANWLLPRPDNENLMLKFQPVPRGRDECWTDNLLECIDWFLSGKKCQISK